MDLSYRELTSTSASFIGQFVAKNKFIRSLLYVLVVSLLVAAFLITVLLNRLNNNRIGDEGAGHIAQMLYINHTLQNLL